MVPGGNQIMQDITTDDIDRIVREGNTALIAGDNVTARQRFRQALEGDPDRVAAWIGLAGSVRPYREKREHLLRALAIDPDNTEAREILAQIESRLAAGEILAPGGVQVREPLPQVEPEPAPVEPEQPAPVTTDYCYIHPNRETGLRCVSCERPICAECARQTPVGQICPECARARRPVNYQVDTSTWLINGVIALIAGLLLSVAALFVIGSIGFFGFIIAFLLGPLAGNLLVRLSDRIFRSKRGKAMQVSFSIGFALGTLPVLVFLALFGGLGGLLPLLLFTILAASTAVAGLR
jgi:hypothetical protein